MHARTYTNPDACATVVRKRLYEVATSLDALRQAALAAQSAYTAHDAEIAATFKRLADAVQIADIGSMDAEKAMAGFPIHKAEESCIPAWMQGHPVELD